MKLKQLLKALSLRPAPDFKKELGDVTITGLTADSRTVVPGNLFIAKKGHTVDGAHFIADAVASGAVALLTDLYQPFFSHIPQIVHPDLQAIEKRMAEIFYGYSLDCLIGITGTSGKTTTAYLVRHLLEAEHRPTGLIGTIEWSTGSRIYPASNTTPTLLQNYKLFHEMALSHHKTCVMEVSSHALDQGRVQDILFDIALFTNLTQDHFDYHKNLQAYVEAKAKLFSSVKKGGISILNSDSPFSCQMQRGPALFYGIDLPADIKAQAIVQTITGVTFDLTYKNQTVTISSPLIGRHNVYNLLAAAAVGIWLDIPLEKIRDALQTFTCVPGRLEKVVNQKGVHVFVDYAHKEDALYNVLKTLSSLKQGKLITVFGCGGNRDQTKRPLMGAVAEEFSDLVIVTSDNPRKENPQDIIRDILVGMKHPEKTRVIVERKPAIGRAIELAVAGDIVLIAGRGHEQRQILSSTTIDFDDRQVALEFLK